MSVDEIVTGRLLDAEIGRSHAKLAGRIETSHAELSGKIDVLATAQEALATTNRVASELASAEHREVRTALKALTDTVADLVAGDQVDEGVRKWRRRTIGAISTAAALVLALAGVLATLAHP